MFIRATVANGNFHLLAKIAFCSVWSKIVWIKILFLHLEEKSRFCSRCFAKLFFHFFQLPSKFHVFFWFLRSNWRQQRSKKKGGFCTHREIFFVFRFPQEAENGHVVQWEVVRIGAHLSRHCLGLGYVPLLRQSSSEGCARSPAWHRLWALPGIALRLECPCGLLEAESWQLMCSLYMLISICLESKYAVLTIGFFLRCR